MKHHEAALIPIFALASLLLAFDAPELRSSEEGSGKAVPTLARPSFWVPPERMAECEQVCHAKVVPILKRHGMAESSERGCPTGSAEGLMLGPAHVENVLAFVDEVGRAR